MPNVLRDQPNALVLDLPEPYQLLDIAGQTVFPVYGAMGTPLAHKAIVIVGTPEALDQISGAIEKLEGHEPFRVIALREGGYYGTVDFDTVDALRNERNILAAVAALQSLEADTQSRLR